MQLIAQETDVNVDSRVTTLTKSIHDSLRELQLMQPEAGFILIGLLEVTASNTGVTMATNVTQEVAFSSMRALIDDKGVDVSPKSSAYLLN